MIHCMLLHSFIASFNSQQLTPHHDRSYFFLVWLCVGFFVLLFSLQFIEIKTQHFQGNIQFCYRLRTYVNEPKYKYIYMRNK